MLSFASFRASVGRLVLAGVLCVLVFPVTAAPAAQVTDLYSFALMFLKRAYPVAEEQGLVASLEGRFEFSLRRAPLPLTSFALLVRHGPVDQAVSTELGPVVFRALFDFDRKNLRTMFVIDGADFVSATKTDTLRKLFLSHPEWGPEEKVASVLQAGARFGPGDEQKILSEARARLTALAELLGETRIIGHEFFYHDGTGWAIEVRTRGTPRVMYQLIFEPFEGRLVGVARM